MTREEKNRVTSVVDSLAAKENRWGHRHVTMILVTYRHGLRVSELTDLRWDQVDLRTATLYVRRVKQGRTRFLI